MPGVTGERRGELGALRNEPRPRSLRVACVVLIVLLFPCAAYNPQVGWWVSLCGAALILGLAWLAWPVDWVDRTGFRMSFRAAAEALVLLAVTAASAYGLLVVATRAAGIQFIPVHERAGFLSDLAFTAGQTLNEEIVLGALLLFGLTRRLGTNRGLAISLGVALVFAVLHHAFYAFREPETFNSVHLSTVALTALFAVGVLRNSLILGSRHIAFAWAIHLGWNAYFFQSQFRFEQTNCPLNEPERFNYLLAYPLMVGVMTFAALISVYLFRQALCGRPENAS